MAGGLTLLALVLFGYFLQIDTRIEDRNKPSVANKRPVVTISTRYPLSEPPTVWEWLVTGGNYVVGSVDFEDDKHTPHAVTGIFRREGVGDYAPLFGGLIPLTMLLGAAWIALNLKEAP